MPIFNDYSENGNFLSKRDEPLNSENIARYMNEHGIDRVKGYQEALEDVLKQINDNILHHTWQNRPVPSTPAAIRRELKKFIVEREIFVKSLQHNFRNSNNLSLPETNSDASLTP